jgi:small-conductance mechanosensitive channel
VLHTLKEQGYSAMLEALEDMNSLIATIIVIAGSALLGLILYFIFIKILGSSAKKSRSILFSSLIKNLRSPLVVILPLITLNLSHSYLSLPEGVVEAIGRVLSIALTVTIAWLIAKFTFVIEDLVLNTYEIDAKDNLKARKVYTQLQFFKKTVVIVISIIALAIILMSFEQIRQLGTAILASAGVIGIIVGFAAQRSISTLLAGLQIAITQPFRIDDVVIVEGEWGRIEEITLTYVVVRIWDLRRLVLPISYFIEKPFQNWTRESADLLGTVFLYTDYTVQVQAIRDELHRILGESEYWDGKVWNLQITNMTEKTVELRALMSAEDASKAWNLRCEVREKLLVYIQSRYPDALPRVRAEFHQKTEIDAG